MIDAAFIMTRAERAKAPRSVPVSKPRRRSWISQAIIRARNEAWVNALLLIWAAGGAGLVLLTAHAAGAN